MTADVDRHRAARLMAEADLAALVVAQPEHFRYLTGAGPGVAALFRRATGALAIVPRDPEAPLAIVCSRLAAPGIRAAQPTADIRTVADWVETLDASGLTETAEDAATLLAAAADRDGRDATFRRAETVEAGAVYGHLADILTERGWRGARIGVDLAFWPAADWAAAAPFLSDVRAVDSSRVVDRLRAVKSSGERDRLRRAALLAEAGYRALLGAIEPGARPADLTAAWSAGVDRAAADAGRPPPGDRWAYISVGPNPWGPGDPVAAGSVIKVDVGTVIDGYSSDSARTLVAGPPSRIVGQIYDMLRRGFDAGWPLLTAGTPCRAVHARIAEAVAEAGFPAYRRGHFGHGLGQDVFSECWPFFSAESDAILEPGMVMAYEVPLYIDGVGGFILEDQVEITEGAPILAWSAPRDLVSVAV